MRAAVRNEREEVSGQAGRQADMVAGTSWNSGGKRFMEREDLYVGYFFWF